MPEASSLALIAGAGRLPALIARSARARGRRVHAIALHALSDPAVCAEADSCEWLHLGEFGRILEAFARANAGDIALAGKVPKAFLWQHRDALRPDAKALAFLGALKDRNDDSLLGAIADVLAAEGHRLASQLDVASDLVAAAGPIAGRAPNEAEWSDIAFGLPVARALGGLDVGQTVVVQGRAVLALEAIEGTDAAIARGLAFAERGKPACVVKTAKPKQDPRFDVPVIGPETLRAIAAGGGSALAVEAGRTLVLDRDELAREAERAGIAVVGVDAGGAPA
ncbi:MAG TPA: UDP-2,3-diacylglucosamine diphosphatase LpxI [Myxococcota bacterium]|jgi:hypothetical protein